MGFKDEWISNYDFLRNYKGWNFYILVDPAGEKKKDSDYTVMAVVGCGPDMNYYLVDAIRDRLNLTERARELFRLHRKWTPRGTGYEKYGMQADVEHIKYEMEIQNYRFPITILGGQTSKNDRIRRLVPLFEQRRFWTPHSLFFVDREKKQHDFMQEFWRDEYKPFPVAVHDDMLDCISRICDEDMKVEFPKEVESPYPSATMEQSVDRCQTEYKLFN
jgi:predicted phage terminase large subunit-like protein